MKPDTAPELTTRKQRERRRQDSSAVDEAATLVLVKLGAQLPCRILDLSIGGCRVRTDERFLAGVMVRVEVSFKVLGTAFRVPGVTQWTNRKDVIGIRFLDISPRKQDQLRELIAELYRGRQITDTVDALESTREDDRPANRS